MGFDLARAAARQLGEAEKERDRLREALEDLSKTVETYVNGTLEKRSTVPLGPVSHLSSALLRAKAALKGEKA